MMSCFLPEHVFVLVKIDSLLLEEIQAGYYKK